jgi:putative transposase
MSATLDGVTTKKQPAEVSAEAEAARELVRLARERGLALTGPDGLLKQLTKTVIETALNEEMTGHLGYAKHDPAGQGAGSGNVRNGTRPKTVLTDGTGHVKLDVPRDRAGTFEPQIVRKRQRRLNGVDEIVLSLYAKGLTTGEISAHFAEIYGASVSKETVSRITDKVIEEMQSWQNRPLDEIYAAVFIDAIVVKIRDGQVANRPVYAAIGVTLDGRKDILGLWAGTGGEGAKFWMSVLLDMKNRGVRDVFFLVCDGLKGLPAVVANVWPQTTVQTCIIHRDCKETTRWFWVPGLIGWYGHLRRGPRSARGAVRGVVAASERAAAAVGVGDRGAAAGSWRGTGGRAGGRGQRDHGPQGSVRTRGRCRAAARGASATGGRRTATGRGR